MWICPESNRPLAQSARPNLHSNQRNGRSSAWKCHSIVVVLPKNLKCEFQHIPTECVGMFISIHSGSAAQMSHLFALRCGLWHLWLLLTTSRNLCPARTHDDRPLPVVNRVPTHAISRTLLFSLIIWCWVLSFFNPNKPLVRHGPSLQGDNPTLNCQNRNYVTMVFWSPAVSAHRKQEAH